MCLEEQIVTSLCGSKTKVCQEDSIDCVGGAVIACSQLEAYAELLQICRGMNRAGMLAELMLDVAETTTSRLCRAPS